LHETSDVPLLIVTGTVGVGKTSVAAEISDILSAHEVPHAFVDLDALSNSWPRHGRFNEEIAYRNLASVWINFQQAGARRLIVSCVVESEDDLARLRETVPGASIVVCRLIASAETRKSRLRGREVGASLTWHLNRTTELEGILRQAALEDFQVQNENRPLDLVAREVLELAGWLRESSRDGE